MSKIYMVKIGIVGNYNVGKTSFLNTYIDQESVSSQLSTIGVDFRHMIYNYDNKEFKLHIWDTAGQEKFRSIITSYFRNANLAIIMIDLNDKKLQLSFFDVEDPKMQEIRKIIETLDIDNLSPVEALIKLNQIKKEIKNED